MLAFYTDGLVEKPGVDLDDSIGRLAHRLARADDRHLEPLIDDLLQHTDTTVERADDVALLVLQYRPAP